MQDFAFAGAEFVTSADSGEELGLVIAIPLPFEASGEIVPATVFDGAVEIEVSVFVCDELEAIGEGDADLGGEIGGVGIGEGIGIELVVDEPAADVGGDEGVFVVVGSGDGHHEACVGIEGLDVAAEDGLEVGGGDSGGECEIEGWSDDKTSVHLAS